MVPMKYIHRASTIPNFPLNRNRDLGHHKMFYVYILKSITDGKYYVGCTDNIDRRLKEHNIGLSKYTKNKGPWMLKYKEEYRDLLEARKREKQIKSWKSRKYIEKLFCC